MFDSQSKQQFWLTDHGQTAAAFSRTKRTRGTTVDDDACNATHTCRHVRPCTTLGGLIVWFFESWEGRLLSFHPAKSLVPPNVTHFFCCCRRWGNFVRRISRIPKAPGNLHAGRCRGTHHRNIPGSTVPIRGGGEKLRRNGVLEGSSVFCGVPMWGEGRQQKRQWSRDR